MKAGLPDPTPPDVVVATSNPGKLREFREIVGGDVRLLDLAGFATVEFPEEGDDYTVNAIAKARAAAAATGLPALADDSGLEVAGLDGAPGPRSARFGGPGLDASERTAALLRAMSELRGDARQARFVCVVALAAPDGTVATARAECRGRILDAPQGEGGFGYDPVFEVEGGVAMAELSPERKNALSHRARALHALAAALARA